jgi:hypothetical protein
MQYSNIYPYDELQVVRRRKDGEGERRIHIGEVSWKKAYFWSLVPLSIHRLTRIDTNI